MRVGERGERWGLEGEYGDGERGVIIEVEGKGETGY